MTAFLNIAYWLMRPCNLVPISRYIAVVGLGFWEKQKKVERKEELLQMGKLNWYLLSSFFLTGMRIWWQNLSILLQTMQLWICDNNARERMGAAWVLWLCGVNIPALDILYTNSLAHEKNKTLNFTIFQVSVTHSWSQILTTPRFKCIQWTLWNFW